jgi:hypothetical protein
MTPAEIIAWVERATGRRLDPSEIIVAVLVPRKARSIATFLPRRVSIC